MDFTPDPIYNSYELVAVIAERLCEINERKDVIAHLYMSGGYHISVDIRNVTGFEMVGDNKWKQWETGEPELYRASCYTSDTKELIEIYDALKEYMA